MKKEIKKCEICEQKDESVNATVCESVVVLGEEITLDLCAKHQKDFHKMKKEKSVEKLLSALQVSLK